MTMMLVMPALDLILISLISLLLVIVQQPMSVEPSLAWSRWKDSKKL
jgi:hypothetical protein